MDSPLFFLVYVSTSTRIFSKKDLLKLVAASRQRNARMGITGMLVHKNGQFMHLIEGEEETVTLLMEKIGRDKRHGELITLLTGQQETRQYPGWTLGFKNLNTSHSKAIESYAPYLELELTDPRFAAEPQLCLDLLKAVIPNAKEDSTED